MVHKYKGGKLKADDDRKQAGANSRQWPRQEGKLNKRREGQTIEKAEARWWPGRRGRGNIRNRSVNTISLTLYPIFPSPLFHRRQRRCQTKLQQISVFPPQPVLLASFPFPSLTSFSQFPPPTPFFVTSLKSCENRRGSVPALCLHLPTNLLLLGPPWCCSNVPPQPRSN